MPGNDERVDLIRFGSVDTRAVVHNGSDITEFAVFAEQNLGADDTPSAHQWVSILRDERVYRTAGNDFSYDHKRYWINGRTFFFLGVYPYGSAVTREEETDALGQTTFKYALDISVPYDANTDYMTAQCSVPVAADQTLYPIVGMEFSHLLAKVAFNIKKSGDYNADDTFVVTQVGLSGISRNAAFVAEHGPNRYVETLTPVSESRQIRRSNLNATINTGGVNVLGENNGLLMVPQSFTDQQVKLSVAYTYTPSGENAEIQYSTLEINIPADQVNRWESGKSYTYNLTLVIDHNIYINTPTVADWGTTQPGGTIIIK